MPVNSTIQKKKTSVPLKHFLFCSDKVRQFWEAVFGCRLEPPAGWVEAGGDVCTGQEDLRDVETNYGDVSELRPEYNVYKAVYALAHALHDLLQCVPGRGPFSGNRCASLQRLEHWQVGYIPTQAHKHCFLSQAP